MLKHLLIIHIDSKIKNIRLVRSLLRTFLEFYGVDDAEIFKMELAINEALANIIEHTYKFDFTRKITVSFSLENEELHVTLRDFGEKIDPSKIKPQLPDGLSEGGRGIYIIKSIVDEYMFDDKVKEGNLLHLRKRLSKTDEDI